MERISGIKIPSVNSKKLYQKLSAETNKAYLLCKINSLVFTIGRFIQRTKFRDEDSINKMYYDFNRANLLNKAFLLFIKQNLLTYKNIKSLEEISEMLIAQRISNNSIMECYNQKFMNLMEQDEYSSITTGQEIKKVLINNKYIRSAIK